MGIDDWHVVSRKKHGYRSYEDDVAKISILIYVSNLPETFSAKDLFHACNKYGHVVDSFIPLKRSKEGKRFGFVKFINVSNVERLVGNLCTVWVGRYKLQANKARFGRPPLNGRNIRNSKSDDRHLGGFKEPNVRPTNGNKETRNNSFASVLKSNQPNNLSSSNMIHDSSPAIALDDDCLSANDLSCVAIGKIKDINALSNLSTFLFGLLSEDLPIVFEQTKRSPNCVSVGGPPQVRLSEDPFGIYNILNKQDNKEAGQDSDPSHPPGFTQEPKKQWIRELNTKNKINFVAIQETNSSVGLSGGILCVWDPNSFVKDNATISDYFVAVRGTWLSTATKVMFVSIYAPQDISEKKSLWEYITHIIDTWDGECIILGDFNEVRSKQERHPFRSLTHHIMEEVVMIMGPSLFVDIILFSQERFGINGEDGFKDCLSSCYGIYSWLMSSLANGIEQSSIPLVGMLKCFFLASGIQIDILKSKLMGIGVLMRKFLPAVDHYWVFYFFHSVSLSCFARLDVSLLEKGLG
ncbi:RNA-directed DNA polymerase, eukaryota [Tanacetum coccineum]